MSKFNLYWGNSVAVRKAFLEIAKADPLLVTSLDLENYNYTDHEGNRELIELTKKYLKEQLGLNYNYVILTNGATGAVTISLRHYRSSGFKEVITNSPHFTLYPTMIETAGMCQAHERESDLSKIQLIDSPSNPLGKIVLSDTISPTIWDSVYHSQVYMPKIYVGHFPTHNVMCGSFSKLTGLNGLRIGWIATNDFFIYENVKKLILGEYCGIDRPGMDILVKLLNNFDWDGYYLKANSYLDLNRENWSKLEKFFAGQAVSNIGMFYYAPMDKSCKKLMDRSGVTYMLGDNMGGSKDFGRFNLGQDMRVIDEAVKEILKTDTIKGEK